MQKEGLKIYFELNTDEREKTDGPKIKDISTDNLNTSI